MVLLEFLSLLIASPRCLTLFLSQTFHLPLTLPLLSRNLSFRFMAYPRKYSLIVVHNLPRNSGLHSAKSLVSKWNILPHSITKLMIWREGELHRRTISQRFYEFHWNNYLYLGEFSFNNDIQESPNHSPFFVNYGFNPRHFPE